MHWIGSPARRIAALVVAVVALGLPARLFAQSAQDINGDGRVDAVFTQKQRYNQVCFGTGTGAFTTCADLTGAGQFTLSDQINTTASALVDWDTDGDLDIVLAMEGRSSVVCHNDGAGQFNTGIGCPELFDYNTFPYNSEDVAVGDLNGDGALDLVFANGGNAGTPLSQPNIACLAGGACFEFGGTPAASTGVALGDIDNDTDLDVVVSNRGSNNEVCLNSGGGSSFDCRAIPRATNTPVTGISNAVAVGNLDPNSFANPDQFLDIVFANDGTNERCWGNGNWSGSNVGLDCSGWNNYAGSGARDVALANIYPNFHGDEIVFVKDHATNVFCFRTVTCATSFSQAFVEAAVGVAVRDINMDGRPDVVVANTGVTAGTSRTYITNSSPVVANGTVQPSSVTLSGGNLGPMIDTTPPAFVGAVNLTVEAAGPNGATAQFTVTAVDVVDGARAVTCAPVSGSLFALGNTTVNCTSSDTSNNVGNTSFLVMVRDTNGPAITVPANITVIAPAGQMTAAVPFSVSAQDVVNGAISSVLCFNTANNFGVAPGAQFAGGTTTLVCGAYDAAQNYGQASFSVTVITDIDSDGSPDNVDTDDDGDGIADIVDTQSLAASADYAFDGTNTGTVSRNGWTVTIAPPSSGSYQARASVTGSGTAPATILARCGGVRKELRLDANGETVEWNCEGNSLQASFVSGTPEFWKFVCDAGCVLSRMTPTVAPSGVSAGSPVTADATNTAPILVTLFTEALTQIGSFSLDAGESVDVDVVAGAPGTEPELQLELLNGGPDGKVVFTQFNQPVTLQQGNGPATFSMTQIVFASGTAAVTTWDPIFPASAYSPWQTQCSPAPSVGPNATWVNPHAAFAFPPGSHPWENIPPFNFAANWINAWSDLLSQGPVGPDGPQSWTKYSTTVTGEGDFVVQFLADNCSWIYVDDQLIGVQDDNWSVNGTGRYPVTLTGAGPHTLSFIILDGGGAAGGKFRLETRQSFIDNGGDPDDLPVKGPSTTSVSFGAGPFTYTGSAFTATASVSPGGDATIVYSGDCTNAGTTCTATATYDGDATHFGSSATASITIDKAPTTTTVGFDAASYVFTGSAIEASASGGATIVYSGSCINVGTCTATATTAGDENHTGSSAVATVEITKAPTTTTVSFSAPSYAYTGSAIAASASAGATIEYTGSCTNVGTCTATATNAGDANHSGSSAVATAEITKAPTTATVSFGAGPFVYKGSAFTATASSSFGTPNVVYSGDCTNAGNTCAATATYGGDANHAGSSNSASITIAKRPTVTTVSFGAGPFVYNGTAFTATASVSPAGTATIVYSGNCVIPGTTCVATATYAGNANQLASSGTATAEITIWPSCQAPNRRGRGACEEPRTNKDNYSMKQNTVLSISAKSGVRKNDGPTPTTIELVSGTSRGSLTLAANGSFVYTPAPGFVGTDSFRYIARSAQGIASDVELVTIQVTKKRGNDDDCSFSDHDRDHDRDRDWSHKGSKYKGSKKHDHDDDDDDDRDRW